MMIHHGGGGGVAVAKKDTPRPSLLLTWHPG
jgi:hypothetical protein